MAEIQGFTVVDDSHSSLADFGTGYTGRDLEAFPLGGLKCSAQRNIKSLTLAEIIEATNEKTVAKSWTSDICDRYGLPVKNQTSSSYCHVHAPTHAMECDYTQQGGKPFILSAFYAGAHVTGGRNVGGSGITDVKFLAEHGTCIESMHPPLPDRNAFHVDNDPAHVANAMLHRIIAWEDLDPRDMLAIYTRIINNMPVTVGIPSWGHEVLVTFLVVENGIVYPGFDNSWGRDWGKNGRGVLTGNKKIFDEAGSIISVTPAAA